MERNIHGGWTIYGSAGIRQYYGYTKKKAIELYRADKNGAIFNMRKEIKNERT